METGNMGQLAIIGWAVAWLTYEPAGGLRTLLKVVDNAGVDGLG